MLRTSSLAAQFFLARWKAILCYTSFYGKVLLTFQRSPRGSIGRRKPTKKRWAAVEMGEKSKAAKCFHLSAYLNNQLERKVYEADGKRTSSAQDGKV